MTTRPHDIAAEQALLGCLMMGGAVHGLQSADFYRPGHQLTLEAIEALSGEGKPTEPVAVADELRHRGQLTKAGGGPYLHTCFAAAPSAAQAGHYASIVRELAERRELLEQAERLQQAASNPAMDLTAIRDLAAGHSGRSDSGTNLPVVLPAVVRLADVEPERIEWLWPGYLPLGKLVVIDGDPGVGQVDGLPRPRCPRQHRLADAGRLTRHQGHRSGAVRRGRPGRHDPAAPRRRASRLRTGHHRDPDRRRARTPGR